jgi:uncharacterized integral membrane protein
LGRVIKNSVAHQMWLNYENNSFAWIVCLLCFIIILMFVVLCRNGTKFIMMFSEWYWDFMLRYILIFLYYNWSFL